jgi:hypothetical protein
MAVDEALIKALAEADGLRFPQDRLAAILRQYQAFLRTLDEIDTVALARETEPAITFSNTLPNLQASAAAERK